MKNKTNVFKLLHFSFRDDDVLFISEGESFEGNFVQL